MTPGEEPKKSMVECVAQAVREFQLQRMGHDPKSVNVVISEGTLVITLQEALTPAEMALSRTVEGAAKVREFHRELFQSSVDALRAEIERVTGVVVSEAAAELQPSTGAVLHVFTSGTMVQVFQLSGDLPADS